MKTTHAAAIGVAAGLVVGIASGAAVTSTPATRAPAVCATALTRAGELLDHMGDLVEQVRLRGDALGKDDYRKHDAAVIRVLGRMEPAEASYAIAAADCRAAS